MGVLIRQRQPGDHTERHLLADLCESTADALFGGCGLHYDPAPGLLNVNLVAVIDERLIGFLDGDQVFAPDEDGEIKPVMPPEGYIHCIGVHPDYRRQGIGRRLLLEALQEYEKLGCVRVELGTPSPSAAVFFVACGGREFGLPRYTGNYEWKLPLALLERQAIDISRPMEHSQDLDTGIGLAVENQISADGKALHSGE